MNETTAGLTVTTIKRAQITQRTLHSRSIRVFTQEIDAIRRRSNVNVSLTGLATEQNVASAVLCQSVVIRVIIKLV